MAIKLWSQSVTELDRNSGYNRAMVRHCARLLDDEVTIDAFGLPPGTYGGSPTASALIGNAYVYHRILGHFIDQAIRAEREGYDGFIVASFAEPFLTEIRAAVNIPVTSLLETSLLVGCSLGERIGLVTTAPNVVTMIRRALAQHRLGERVCGVVSLDPPLGGPGLHESFENPGPALERFEAAARPLLAQGADVLVPAEGILAVMMSDRGYNRFEDAPVIDVFGVTWSYAAMLANLRKRGGLGMTRRGRYQQPNPAFIETLKSQAL